MSYLLHSIADVDAKVEVVYSIKVVPQLKFGSFIPVIVSPMEMFQSLSSAFVEKKIEFNY